MGAVTLLRQRVRELEAENAALLTVVHKATYIEALERLVNHARKDKVMVKTADIEIIEPVVKVENDASINLDTETSRHLYALAWEKFEKALVSTNALYSEEPDPGQQYQFNRVKRLLWEVADLNDQIRVIFSMTALPDDMTEDDAHDRGTDEP